MASSHPEQDEQPPVNARFTSQAPSTEDVQPIGLFNLNDYRKKRDEASNQKQESLPNNQAPGLKLASKKKKRKQPGNSHLSFDNEEDDEDQTASKRSKPDEAPPRKKLGANTSLAAPKVMTKSAQLKAAETKEQLRKEFLAKQEILKTQDFEIPFVFFDGTNNPGGKCRIKKGEHVWLFLDRCRKIGAEIGISSGASAGTRREWARVSVDDLMLVRGEIIIPHHFDFYYFIINKIKGHDGQILFPYTTDISLTTDPETDNDLKGYDPLTAYQESKKAPETTLEGADEDPTFTKVVDRRWYERNKHIYPASAWETFDATKDYSKTVRRDNGGNVYFFS